MADHYSGDPVNAENAAGNLQQKEICVGCKRAGGDVFPAIFNGKLSTSCLCAKCRSLMQDSKSDVSCTNGGSCDDSSDCNPCRISRIFKATGVPVGILVCNCCGRKKGDATGFSTRHNAPNCCNTCATWFHKNYQKPHTCRYGTTYECSMIQKPDDITTVRCKGCKLQRCRILGMKHKNESHKRDNDNLQDGPPPKITATSEAISSEGNVGQQFLTDDTMPRPEILVNNSLPESDTVDSILNANIDSVNSMDFEPSKFEQLLESVVSPPPKITTTSEAISSEGNVGEQPSGDEIIPCPEILVNNSLPEPDTLSTVPNANISSVDSMDFEPQVPDRNSTSIIEFERLLQAGVSPQTQDKRAADQSLEKHVLHIKAAHILEISNRKFKKVEEICNKGDNCYNSGDFLTALALYSNAIDHYGHSKFYAKRSATFCVLRCFEKALQDAEESIRRDPSLEFTSCAYEAKIYALHALGKDDKMLKWFEEQSDRFRGNELFVKCIRRVATCFCTTKQYKLCSDFLGKQLEKFPNSEEVRSLLEHADSVKLCFSEEISDDEPEDIPGTSGTQSASAADVQLNELFRRFAP